MSAAVRHEDDCGCTIVDGGGLGGLQIVRCQVHERAVDLCDLVGRLARTTVGHGCVPLTGNDGESGLIAEAASIIRDIEGH